MSGLKRKQTGHISASSFTTVRLLNLKDPKTLTRFGVSSSGGLSLTKSPQYETGIGFGQRFFALPSRITKLLLSLFPRLKGTITFTISMKRGKNKGTTNHGVLHRMTIQLFQRRR